MRKILGAVIGVIYLMVATHWCKGFSLVGPFASEMTPAYGYDRRDIGGPMPLQAEYRWNVPVVTYGFDDSFRAAFGTNGVAAVQEAVALLNALPPATDLVPTNYPLNPVQYHLNAQAQHLSDLKSATLGLLLEQMGLLDPKPNVWRLQEVRTNLTASGMVDPADYTLVQRHYDPETLQPTNRVNGFVYVQTGLQYFGGTGDFLLNVVPADPLAPETDTVTGLAGEGVYYEILSPDDIGGLRYLYASTNWNGEVLLPDVTGAGTNAAQWVDTARRPGREKIVFAPQAWNAAGHDWLPATNFFTDHFITNGQPGVQQLRRIVTRPDILFTAHRPEVFLQGEGNETSGVILRDVRRTPAAHWQNLSLVHSGTNGPGPGIIRPGISLSFPDTALLYAASGQSPDAPGFFDGLGAHFWGSFDSAPATLLLTGGHTNVTELPLRVQWQGGASNLVWTALAHWNAIYRIEHSADLAAWYPLQMLTNTHGIFTLTLPAVGDRKFFRAVKQTD